MCFIFLFYVINFYIERKKKLAADAGAAQRLFSGNWKFVVVNKNTEGLLMALGVTASFVMHFWFDQYYYYWTGKKKLKDPSATNGVSGGALGQNFWSLFSFVFLWLIHCSVCAVVLLVFRGEQSLLYQVMWARACVGICNEQTNLHPDGQTLTQLATSVHSVWWNACLLMQIFI